MSLSASSALHIGRKDSALSVIHHKSSSRSGIYNCNLIANNTAILVTHNNPIEASLHLQESLLHSEVAKKERIKANGIKSVYV